MQSCNINGTFCLYVTQIQDASQQQLLQRLIGDQNQTTVLGTDNVAMVQAGQQVINTIQGHFNQQGHFILAGGDTTQLGSKFL